jgi:predicted metal-binding protein
MSGKAAGKAATREPGDLPALVRLTQEPAGIPAERRTVATEDPFTGNAGGGAAQAVTILVCSSCRGPDGSDARPRPGAALAAATEARSGGDFAVRSVECLGNCKRRLSAALASRNAWTYVFGDLGEASAADLVAGAKLLRDSSDGLLPWRGRPDSLKRGLVARVPPLFAAEESR